MKALKSLLLIASVGALVTFSSCGSDKKNTEPVPDVQLGKLSKTWKLTSVTLGGAPVTTPSYTGFQLAITGTKGATSFGYSATGRPSLSPWKSSGTWAFGTDPVTMLVRDPATADELAMNYAVTETTLQISFNYTGKGFTRVDQVTGDWVFIFGL